MSSKRLLTAFAVLALLLSTLVATAQPGSSQGAVLPPIGVRATSDGVASNYSNWLGREITHVLDYSYGSTWDSIQSTAIERAGSWRGSSRKLVLSIPMLPSSGSLAAGASGAYDQTWRNIASGVAAGRSDAIIRLGWEHNGNWFTWSSIGDSANYAAYFRRIVDIFRAVPGNSFRFEWNVNYHPASLDTASYPGDSHVDIIGMDIYDMSYGEPERDPIARFNGYLNNPTGLNWLANFASARGKQIAFSEWGLSQDHLSGVNPDNPYFIQQMHSWMSARAGQIAYSLYFEDSPAHSNSRLMGATPFPNASATFRSLFGSGVSISPTTAAPSPTTQAPSPTTTAPARPAVTTTQAPSPTTTAPARTTVTTAPARTTVTTAPARLAPGQCAASTNPPNVPSASSGRGYWLLDSSGRVHAYDTPHLGDLQTRGISARAIGLTPTRSGDGYLILDDRGVVHAFGDAKWAGDASGLRVVSSLRAIAPGAKGYWLVAGDGGVFAFGESFHGSMGGHRLDGPVISIAATGSGRGYWLVGSDGGVFAFGDAGFHGSTGGMRLNAPVISMAASPSGSGYWLYARDGGVFAFDVPFYGSLPGLGLCDTPVAVQMRVTQSGNGYYIISNTGAVYTFGDASFHGGSPSLAPGVEVVDLAVRNR